MNFDEYYEQIVESTNKSQLKEAHTTDPGLIEWLQDKSAMDLLEFIKERNPEIYSDIEDEIREEMGYFGSEEKDVEDVTAGVEVPEDEEGEGEGEDEEDEDKVEPDRVLASPEEIDGLINQDEPEIDFDSFDPDND